MTAVSYVKNKRQLQMKSSMKPPESIKKDTLRLFWRTIFMWFLTLQKDSGIVLQAVHISLVYFSKFM